MIMEKPKMDNANNAVMPNSNIIEEKTRRRIFKRERPMKSPVP